jgi:hypothetical protein
MKIPLLATSCTLLIAGCADVAAPEASEELGLAARAAGPRLLQAGAGFLPLEVTDDDYAIYQDGADVFAASLAGGPRQPIASAAAGNTAFVYRVGKVAFVWTNPNRALANFGVSPLVIWSAATGPHLASRSSAVGTLASAATRHGDHVIFPANSTPDGTVGDLVYASTDLATQTTLVAGAQMGFAVGPCNPLATFLGHDPIALYCTADPATATLSRWTRGVRRDLVAAAATPPQLAIDPARERVLTLAAGTRNPLLVDDDGRVTTIADVSARIPSFGPDGSIFYVVRAAPAPAPVQLFRARPRAPTLLGDLLGIYPITFGSRSFAAPLTSPDGRSILALTAIDPTTGYSNVVRFDARDNHQVTIDAAPVSTIFGPPFSSDSRFALYAHGDPTFTTFTGPMFAADRHGTRQFSDDAGWSYATAAGDTVVYNDAATPNLANFALTTADLKAVDLDCGAPAPRLIATQANGTFFVTHDLRRVVYTTDQAGSPGLYVARAR